MHSAMGWCKHGYINQMNKLASNWFQGIAGRSNIERPTSNFKCEKRSELLDDTLQETEELIKIFVTSIKTAEKKRK
jgi:hypothetical protein